ncbi:MAG: PVC-type heme-binding CxxCH protein, partial [Bryobacteraceae bacterium]
MRLSRTWYFSMALLALLPACRTGGPPYAAGDALAQFEIERGFRIELFASEPAVASPVAMEFDEDGRIFVVEDRGYPLETAQPLGRIKLLEDTNGDGRPDKTTIFADGLKLPTGVMRWKKGILVTDAPFVWYLEDTDGDGRADRREKVLEGFAFTNPQHTVNTPLYGLDNWIYLAHENATTAVVYKDRFGDPGSDIRFSGKAPGPAIVDRARNVRFQPDSGRLEALAGSSQFGHTFDAWGHHFTLNNSNHTRHEVLSAAAVRRNPHLALANAMQDVSDHGAAAKVFPITRNPEFQMLTNAGEFTSACGLTMYLGGGVPAWDNSSFVAEPVHNLVHRDVWTPQGSTFRTSRATEGREFLASRDPWFRPVNFYIGPDGALYVIDYYRQLIEHPEWMSAEVSRGPDLYNGQDRGRIYRITRSDNPPPLPRGIQLSKAPDAELVARLADPNIWWRRTAQRLLVDRHAVGMVPGLLQMARQNASPVGRLHALWTLEGLGKLDPALIEQALRDTSPGVRENAVRLAESFSL